MLRRLGIGALYVAGGIFFLEGFGTPLPVEIPLYIIGRQVHDGRSLYWQMVLLMWLTTVAGNTVGYVIGYYGGRPLMMRVASWFRVNPASLERMETWFRRYGLWLTLGTRWLNWGFAQNMWLCGITRVPFPRFLAVMAVNDLAWAMAWTYVAAALVRRIHVVLQYPGRIAAVLLIIGIPLFFLIRWWRQRQQPPAA